MAIGKELGEYQLKSTGTRYNEDGGGAAVDLDGTATGFGTVLGTLIVRAEPGATGGSASWRGQSFLDNGERSAATGEGTWEDCGTNQWRVRLIVSTTNGQTFATDGVLDLGSRSMNGKLLDWS